MSLCTVKSGHKKSKSYTIKFGVHFLNGVRLLAAALSICRSVWDVFITSHNRRIHSTWNGNTEVIARTWKANVSKAWLRCCFLRESYFRATILVFLWRIPRHPETWWQVAQPSLLLCWRGPGSHAVLHGMYTRTFLLTTLASSRQASATGMTTGTILQLLRAQVVLNFMLHEAYSTVKNSFCLLFLLKRQLIRGK